MPEHSSRRRDWLVVAVLVALLGLLLVAFPRAAVAEDEPDTGDQESPQQSTQIAVDDAVLRWGMSNEANNRAPSGAYNFFSAGSAAKPAGAEMAAAEWSQQSGAVAIEKWDGTRYLPATWAGLRTDATGTTIPDYRSGRYSGHQWVFSGGNGVADPVAGTAHIAWAGTVSVIFYGGNPFFRITDPVLDVRADGTGVLTGTISGIGSSRDNPGESFEIAPVRVTLADLPAVDLAETGFTVTPAYDGVRVEVAGRQVTDSFPQTFVTVMDELGTAPFWHRSGGALDGAKKALPITVSYDAAKPVDEVPPPTTTPHPVVENSAPPAPEVVRETVTTTITATITAPAVAAPAPPAATASAATPTAGLAPVASGELQTLLASRPPTASGDARLWWAGGLLLALAVLVLAGAAFLPVRPSDVASGNDPA